MNISAVISTNQFLIGSTSKPFDKCVCLVHCICVSVYSVHRAAAVTRQDCYQVLSNTVFQHGTQQQGDLFQWTQAGEQPS